MQEYKGPEFILVQPDAVRSALFELTHPETHIIVRDTADREITAVVLGVDKQTGVFFWRPRDLAGLRQADQRGTDIFTGAVFHFIATGYGGVRIHFRVPRPEAITFDDGSAAYFSPLPDRLSRIQRRAMFRASLSGIPVTCSARWRAGGEETHFTLRDISIEGVGLRAEKPVSALPSRDAIMRGVMLQFGDLGTLKVDLEVRNAYAVGGAEQAEAGVEQAEVGKSAGEGSSETSLAAGANRSTQHAGASALAAPTPAPKVYETHLGAMITGLSPRDEVWLQQMVWRLEKLRGSRVEH